MEDYKGIAGDYANTNRGYIMKKISSKAKTVIFVVAVIVVLLSILIGNVLIRNYRITNELTAIAESHGLKDIKISIGSKIPDYDFYNVTVESSNLESLSYSKMYSLADDMHADDAFVSEYTCNGNSYKIYPSTKGIYKNGTKIHDDYRNSDSYKDATKNDKNKSDYYSSNNSSSSYSFTPYRSPSKDDHDDPYNAKDYSNEEDFYYDHYDDFFDYYDAEDYYNEHND